MKDVAKKVQKYGGRILIGDHVGLLLLCGLVLWHKTTGATLADFLPPAAIWAIAFASLFALFIPLAYVSSSFAFCVFSWFLKIFESLNLVKRTTAKKIIELGNRLDPALSPEVGAILSHVAAIPNSFYSQVRHIGKHQCQQLGAIGNQQAACAKSQAATHRQAGAGRQHGATAGATAKASQGDDPGGDGEPPSRRRLLKQNQKKPATKTTAVKSLEQVQPLPYTSMDTKLALTLPDLATLVGGNIRSMQNAYYLRPHDFPPAISIPGCRGARFLRQDVEAWLQSRKHPQPESPAVSSVAPRPRGRPRLVQQMGKEVRA